MGQAAHRLAARLPGGERFLGAVGYDFSLVLGDGSQDVNGEPIRLREIDGDKIYLRLHEVCDEGDVAGQAVELGDYQHGALALALGEGLCQFGPVVSLPGLDLGVFTDQLRAVAVYVVENGLALGVEPQAAPALPVGGNTIIGNVFFHCHGSNSSGGAWRRRARPRSVVALAGAIAWAVAWSGVRRCRAPSGRRCARRRLGGAASIRYSGTSGSRDA